MGTLWAYTQLDYYGHGAGLLWPAVDKEVKWSMPHSSVYDFSWVFPQVPFKKVYTTVRQQTLIQGLRFNRTTGGQEGGVCAFSLG